MFSKNNKVTPEKKRIGKIGRNKIQIKNFNILKYFKIYKNSIFHYFRKNLI